MLSTRSSSAKGRNPDFRRVGRKPREQNDKWIGRNLPKDGWPCLILLGGGVVVDCGLRVAESRACHVLTPSHWSDVALLEGSDSARASTKGARLYEVALEPSTGFGYPPITNGVQESSLDKYADHLKWPNVAVVYL